MSSLKEAKDALMNVAIDYLQAYSQLVVSSQRHNALLSPVSLRLIPTYCLALLKNVKQYSVSFCSFFNYRVLKMILTLCAFILKKDCFQIWLC